MYKQRCLMVLKKRKMYDNQLKNYMSQQMTLDQVAFTSESIQNTLEMVFLFLSRAPWWKMLSRTRRISWEISISTNLMILETKWMNSSTKVITWTNFSIVTMNSMSMKLNLMMNWVNFKDSSKLKSNSRKRNKKSPIHKWQFDLYNLRFLP